MKKISVILIILSFYLPPSFAAPEVYIKSGSGSGTAFGVRGGFAVGEINKRYNTAFDGLVAIYNSDMKGVPGFVAKDYNFVCSKDISVATAQINSFLSSAVLKATNGMSAGMQDYIFRVTCKTSPPGSPDQYNDVYYYDNRIGKPVNPNSPYCTFSLPSSIDFGEVQIGDTRATKATAQLQCDKDANVKIALTSGRDSNGEMIISGTKIKYYLDNNAITQLLKITANNPVELHVNVDLITTGETTGIKDGYILMSSEVQ